MHLEPIRRQPSGCREGLLRFFEKIVTIGAKGSMRIAALLKIEAAYNTVGLKLSKIAELRAVNLTSNCDCASQRQLYLQSTDNEVISSRSTALGAIFDRIFLLQFT